MEYSKLLAIPVVVMIGRGQLHLDNMECVSHKNENLLPAEIVYTGK